MAVWHNMKEAYKKVSQKKGFVLCTLVPWIVLCLLLAAFVVCNGKYKYETNDDITLELITGGAFGRFFSRNVFNNVALGWVLARLYQTFPGCNWSNILFFSLILLSYMFFGICMILRNKVIKGYLISFIFVGATIKYTLLSMSFVKTASLVMVVGVVCLISSMDNDRWLKAENRVMRIVAYVLIFLGAAIRKENVIAMVPFYLLAVAYLLVKNSKERIRRCIPCIGVLLAVALLWIGDFFAYYCDEEWKDYKEYTAIRSELVDYGVPSYEEHEQAYADIGLSYNDYLMLTGADYPDNDVFGIETFRKILSIRESEEEGLSLSVFFKKIGETVGLSSSYLVICVVFFVFLTLSGEGNQRNFLLRLGALMVYVGELWYLLYVGRANERAVMSLTISVLAILFLFTTHFDEEKNDKPKNARMVVCMVLVLIYTYFACEIAEIKYRKPYVCPYKSEAMELFSYVADNRDKLYVMNGYGYVECMFDYHAPLDAIPQGILSNVYVMSGWLKNLPFINDMARGYGDEYNIMSVLASNKDVYMISEIDSDNVIELTYIREHYNENAEVRTVDTLERYKIISFTAGE